MATDKLINEKNTALFEAGRKLEHVRLIGYFLQELPEHEKMSTPCAFDPYQALGALLFDLGHDGSRATSEAIDLTEDEDKTSHLPS